MNANYIINMVMRMVMRKAVSGGINAGINAASGMGKRRKKKPQQHVDDYGYPAESLPRTMPGQDPEQAAPATPNPPKLTQEQRAAKRAMRQARRAARGRQG